MQKPLKFWAIAPLLAVFLNGCAVALIGVGAAGGYAISRDTVIGQIEKPEDVVYSEALNVAQEMGLVYQEDLNRGLIRLTVQNVRVQILVRRVTPKVTELRIKARNKVWMPKVQVAQDLYSQILKKLS